MTVPQPGDYGCVRIGGGVGKGIGVAESLLKVANSTSDRYSYGEAKLYQHAFLYVDTDTIVEAEIGGAVQTTMHYPPDEVLWSHNDLTLSERLAVVRWATTRVGVPYSLVDYAAIAAHGLHLPVPGLKEYISATGHQICSQMTDWCYMKAGVQLFADKRWPGYVVPADLAYLARQE